MIRILLLDDEMHVISALTRCLRQNFQNTAIIEGFTDPQAAITRSTEICFDIIITDYRMPEMDGITLLKSIVTTQPDIIRFILSATEDFDVLVTAINEAGITRFLSKPWEEALLVSTLRQAIETVHQRREERRLSNERRLDMHALTPQELEKLRLEHEEPGLTQVNWGPNGEVLLEDD